MIEYREYFLYIPHALAHRCDARAPLATHLDTLNTPQSYCTFSIYNNNYIYMRDERRLMCSSSNIIVCFLSNRKLFK